jgi:hypothetical protein
MSKVGTYLPEAAPHPSKTVEIFSANPLCGGFFLDRPLQGLFILLQRKAPKKWPVSTVYVVFKPKGLSPMYCLLPEKECTLLYGR